MTYSKLSPIEILNHYFAISEELIVINQSRRPLTGHFSTTPPIFIRHCDSLFTEFEKILHDDQQEAICVYFLCDKSNSERKSEKYSCVLRIEFDEHADTVRNFIFLISFLI